MQRGRSRGDGGRDRSGAAGPGEHQGPGPPQGLGEAGGASPASRRMGPANRWTSASHLRTEVSVALRPSVCGRCTRPLPWLSAVAAGAGPGGEGEVGSGPEFRMLLTPSLPHGASQLPQCQGMAGVQGAPHSQSEPSHTARGAAPVSQRRRPRQLLLPPNMPTPVPPTDTPVHAAPPAPRRHAHPHRGWPRSFSSPFRGAMRLRGEHTQLEARFGVSVKNWVL